MLQRLVNDLNKWIQGQTIILNTTLTNSSTAPPTPPNRAPNHKQSLSLRMVFIFMSHHVLLKLVPMRILRVADLATIFFFQSVPGGHVTPETHLRSHAFATDGADERKLVLVDAALVKANAVRREEGLVAVRTFHPSTNDSPPDI